MNQTRIFLKEVAKLQSLPIPDAVYARAKKSLLDYLAVACAGARFQKEKLENYYEFAVPEAGEYCAIGTGRKVTLKESVFLNGLNGHALDYDDGTNSGIIHLGSPIFSLLLPLAQKHGICLKDMLTAAIFGYEVSYTMAVTIQPEHKKLGYHATGTCGVLGATIAAAYMLHFTEEETFQAFGAACVSASGMLKVLDEGSELKPYNVAKTALLALTSLQLAKGGWKCAEDPLAGRGFFQMMLGRQDVEIKPFLLNGKYAIMKSYTKPYASCRYTHPPVEAAIHLRNAHGLNADDVKSIKISTYSLAVSGHDHKEIPSVYSAKMSTPYSVAAALIFGKAGLQEFTDELIRDREMLNLVKKIDVSSDDEFSARFPEIQTAVVEIETEKETYSERVDFPKGEPENPMTDDEFASRYEGLMNYAGIDDATHTKVFNLVKEGILPVSDLMKLFES